MSRNSSEGASKPGRDKTWSWREGVPAPFDSKPGHRLLVAVSMDTIIRFFDSTCYRPRWTGKVKWLAALHRFTFNVFHRWSFFAVWR